MSLSKVLFSTILCAAVVAPSTSNAATTNAAARCDQLLNDLGPKQDTLSSLEKAIAEGRARQEALLVEANDIGFAIANQLTAGAAESDVQTLVDERDALFAEVAQIDDTLAPVELQADALTTEIDAASRGYIACIESTIG